MDRPVQSAGRTNAVGQSTQKWRRRRLGLELCRKRLWCAERDERLLQRLSVAAVTPSQSNCVWADSAGAHLGASVLDVADRFVVLQQGENYADIKREDTDPQELVEIIAGRKYVTTFAARDEAEWWVKEPAA